MTMPDDRRFDPETDSDLIPETNSAETNRADTTPAGTDRTDFGRTEVGGTGTEAGIGTEAGVEPGATQAAPGIRSESEPLVDPDAVVDFRARWDVIQQGFVDDPRNAVSEANHLVDDLLARLSEMFDSQRRDLEKEWSDGEPSTEDLRTALQRYRSFFRRLLTL